MNKKETLIKLYNAKVESCKDSNIDYCYGKSATKFLSLN